MNFPTTKQAYMESNSKAPAYWQVGIYVVNEPDVLHRQFSAT